MPEISIIVPVYNVEKYLNRCIDSILIQTFTDFELILIDDGSTDGSGKICDEYAAKDSRVVVIHKKNGGAAEARNAGIDWSFENSQSKWIAFIDSDDWVHPRYLEILLDAVTKNNLGISVCGYIETEKEVTPDKLYGYNAVLQKNEEFFVHSGISSVVPWGKLYNKKLFTDIRYPVGKLHEDEFTTYKLLFKCDNVAVIDNELYYYYVNNGSITRSGFKIRNLDVIVAFLERIEYFENLGKYDLVKWQIDVTVSYLVKKAKLLSNENMIGVDKSALRIISKKMRIVLKQYKSLLPFNGNEWLYEIAYPKRMQIYWIVKAQLNKIRK